MESGWALRKTADKANDFRRGIHAAERGVEGAAVDQLGKKSMRNTAKAFLEGFAKEGAWEENIQESVSKYYKQYAEAELGKDDNIDSIGENYARGLKGFAQNMFAMTGLVEGTKKGTTEDDASAAIMLGGVIGGPANMISSITERARKDTAYNAQKQGW
jgi:hypothetical protein